MISVKRVLSRFGYQIIRKQANLDKISKKLAENFPRYLKEAEANGEDVNDYINRNVGNPKQLIERIVTPYIGSGRSCDCIIEIGPGTGRFSRELANFLSDGKDSSLYLFDHSNWLITFLTRYFESNQKIKPVQNDGLHLPLLESNSADLVFANGVFIELNLARIYTYCKDSYKVLKPGGYFIFNYLDLDFQEAWDHMKKSSENPVFSFTYFTGLIIDRLFLEEGFEFEKRSLIGQSAYVVYRKP